MDTTIYLEIYEKIATHLRLLLDYQAVEGQFYNVLVIYSAIVLVFGYVLNKRLTMILSFSLMTLLISYIMRNVENTGYIVTTFSLVALLTSYTVFNRKFENHVIFVGFLNFYLFRLLALNVWIALFIAVLLAIATYWLLPKITLILTSVVFGSIVLTEYLVTNYGLNQNLIFILLFVEGLIIQVQVVGIRWLISEFKQLFSKEKGVDS